MGGCAVSLCARLIVGASASWELLPPIGCLPGMSLDDWRVVVRHASGALGPARRSAPPGRWAGASPASTPAEADGPGDESVYAFGRDLRPETWNSNVYGWSVYVYRHSPPNYRTPAAFAAKFTASARRRNKPKDSNCCWGESCRLRYFSDLGTPPPTCGGDKPDRQKTPCSLWCTMRTLFTASLGRIMRPGNR